MSYPGDGESFYTSNSDYSLDEIREMNNQDIGADVVEEDIAPELIERRDGWDVVYAEQKGGTDAGIDVIAKDADGNYVITEVKFTGKSSTPGKGMFDSFRGDHRQMEDEWIQDAFDDEIDEGSFDEYTEVKGAIRSNDYRKEAIVVQDASSGKSITKGLTDFGFDDVTVVRTGGVTK
ncbi:hypothetical protein SAMN05216559_1961 [Halomicrobium zhouii]|uniref:Uncharacterized protein n=1 Tax=Halomicrobium zhouii TaxID=767519 RepID=A0A1I6L3K9_9EURY|nr:hypothetical protein [Halomicrobium zhouii]SFR98036.1 hypothetical protein SAMN05216559_1961 [Halomicrobium zhouii]